MTAYGCLADPALENGACSEETPTPRNSNYDLEAEDDAGGPDDDLISVSSRVSSVVAVAPVAPEIAAVREMGIDAFTLPDFYILELLPRLGLGLWLG